jgi:hypothetical protein
MYIFRRADSSAERAAKRAKIDEHESADASPSAAQPSPEVEVQPATKPPRCESLEQAAGRQHAACMQYYIAKQSNDSESAHAALQAIWTHAPYMHQAHWNRCSQSCDGSLPCLDIVLAHIDSSSSHVVSKDVYAAVESASGWLCLPAVQRLLLWAPSHMTVQLWQCALVSACQSAHSGSRDCSAAERFAALPLEQQREQQLHSGAKTCVKLLTAPLALAPTSTESTVVALLHVIRSQRCER